jgi:PadR family transcriptional regulator, regulatory protein PadR
MTNMPEDFESWTTQVRKGILELSVLNALAGEERYGYELVKALVAVPGLGVTEGTIYPLLSRLRLQGLVDARLVESSEGPARKYYRLTADGRTAVGLMNRYVDELVSGLRSLRQWGKKS